MSNIHLIITKANRQTAVKHSQYLITIKRKVIRRTTPQRVYKTLGQEKARQFFFSTFTALRQIKKKEPYKIL